MSQTQTEVKIPDELKRRTADSAPGHPVSVPRNCSTSPGRAPR